MPNEILSLPRLPARLNMDEIGRILGFTRDELSVLLRTKQLIPLGKPAANGHKFFAAVEIEELAKDKAWLDKATKTVGRAWQEKNQSRSRR